MNIKTVIEPAKSVIVRKYCECGGEFIPVNTNMVLTCYPPRYGHECNKCGQTALFNRHYPSFEVRALDWEGDNE